MHTIFFYKNMWITFIKIFFKTRIFFTKKFLVLVSKNHKSLENNSRSYAIDADAIQIPA